MCSALPKDNGMLILVRCSFGSCGPEAAGSVGKPGRGGRGTLISALYLRHERPAGESDKGENRLSEKAPWATRWIQNRNVGEGGKVDWPSRPGAGDNPDAPHTNCERGRMAGSDALGRLLLGGLRKRAKKAAQNPPCARCPDSLRLRTLCGSQAALNRRQLRRARGAQAPRPELLIECCSIQFHPQTEIFGVPNEWIREFEIEPGETKEGARRSPFWPRSPTCRATGM